MIWGVFASLFGGLPPKSPTRGGLRAIERGFGFLEQGFDFLDSRFGLLEQDFGFLEQGFDFSQQAFGFLDSRFGFLEQGFDFSQQGFGFLEQGFDFLEQGRCKRSQVSCSKKKRSYREDRNALIPNQSVNATDRSPPKSPTSGGL
ncbi:hypothetical protein [Leptolyngbya sp. FACHB-17]|uniref:hypothetical protein n=1 Tax=Leptolyngbya sp. FACHB-17 TaxID=2692803 RepID=UPI0016812BC2|nr:hypothetical protein [Leptolyngbya sp. FACHB-17]MBD2079923.1 hypothetical protein [Leptolyngbya sp. FACHB-17]